jgi:abhydrolase domain-containing protein 6
LQCFAKGGGSLLKTMRRAVKTMFLLLLLLCAAATYIVAPHILVKSLVNLNRQLSGLSAHRLKVDSHELHYLDGGAVSGDGKTVVLLHGIFAEKDHWVDFARKLTADYRVVILDLPGFGDSSRLADQSYQYAPQVERLHTFIEKLGIRQFHLAGNSMGGTIAALLSVTFVGAPHGIRAPTASIAEQRIAKGELPLIARSNEEFAQMMSLLFVKQPFLPHPIYLDAQARAVRDAASNVRLWEDQKRDGYLLQNNLPQLKTRTLALWGEKDRVFDPSGAQVLRALLPSARIEMLPETGHLPMMEFPADTAARYRVFLEMQKNAN